MKLSRIPVKVSEGMFPSERVVSFEAGGRQYTLFVDQEDVQDGMLQVYVVEQSEEEAIVDLPRDTFTTGNRIRIPRSTLAPA